MSAQWITQNRIKQEMKSIAKEKPSHLFAAPLPDNLFVWHFTITGPEGTSFHSGIYHGEIILPKQYPFKPPEIFFINHNGRFQPFTKICLSITQYHPETWSAGISIRMMLQAIIAIFDDNVPGIGAVQASPQIRMKLAQESHYFHCQKCGQINKILQPRPALDIKMKSTEKKSDEAFSKFINEIPLKIKQQELKEQVPKLQDNNQIKNEKQAQPSKIKRFFNWFRKKQ